MANTPSNADIFTELWNEIYRFSQSTVQVRALNFLAMNTNARTQLLDEVAKARAESLQNLPEKVSQLRSHIAVCAAGGLFSLSDEEKLQSLLDQIST